MGVAACRGGAPTTELGAADRTPACAESQVVTIGDAALSSLLRVAHLRLQASALGVTDASVRAKSAPQTIHRISQPDLPARAIPSGSMSQSQSTQFKPDKHL